jgi:hypothetical protein
MAMNNVKLSPFNTSQKDIFLKVIPSCSASSFFELK